MYATGGSKESSPVDKGVTLLVAPAPLLAKNHPLAGSWLRFPGSALTREALQTFVFMESAPLVGQFDWRASEVKPKKEKGAGKEWGLCKVLVMSDRE